jgi:hypothetical protein
VASRQGCEYTALKGTKGGEGIGNSDTLVSGIGNSKKNWGISVKKI